MAVREIFYLTFGQSSPARNGWIEVHAYSYADARQMAIHEYGRGWSCLYMEHEFVNRSMFWAGRLGDLR